MPTIVAVSNRTGVNLNVIVTAWTPLAVGDDGSAVEMPGKTTRSVHVRGTFGGTTVTIQGSNEVTPTDWQPLTAPGGAALAFTAAGLREVVETTRWIRPVVVGGAGATISVEMIDR